jgi:predicted MFS family arabinose efflux permease
VLAPWLSSFADLFPRRMLLVLCDLARAVCVGLILVPGIPLLLVMVLLFLEATWRIPWGAARLALLTDILTREEFPAANALIAAVRQALQVAGFAIGGLVVVLVGVRPTLAFDSITFALSAGIIWFAIRPREAPWRDHQDTTDPAARRPGTWASTVEGVRAVIRHRRMMQLFALLGLGPAMSVITEGLAVPLADELGGGVQLAGLIMAAPPLGTVVGLFALGRLRFPVQRRLVGPLSIGTGLSVVLACAGVAAPGADAIVLVLLFVGGVCVAYIATIQSEISRMVATSLRGRVFGLANAVMQISQGLAIVLAGLLAGTGRLALAIAIIAAALTLMTAIVLRLRPKRSRAMTMSPA